MEFKKGQRWISETEPELGLGILESASRHQVRLVFPAANEARMYAPDHAPIKRVAFRAGDTIRAESGDSLVIETVREESGLLVYLGEGREVPEAALADSISFSKPEDRLIGGQVDGSSAFALRYEALTHQGRARQSEVSGFVGGRIDLIPHQLYIASEVSNRYLPRVLLADEVGLGKTIEACLVLHRLHLTGRASRILIVVPESLVHQWFVELLRRFNLWFTLFDEERGESVAGGDGEVNPFLQDQLVICSIATLAGRERWGRAAVEAEWDMLVVDEAHHLEWSPAGASPEYALVEALSQRSGGLLLLTATPEQLGAAGHFARLRLLDPDRYPDLEGFRREQADYAAVAALAGKLMGEGKLGRADAARMREVFAEYDAAEFDERFGGALDSSGAARERLLRELVDRHGTGRVVFRNTREALQGFPERRALPVPVPPRATLSEEALRERLLAEFDFEVAGATNADPVFDYRHGPRIRWLAELLRELGEEKVLLICRTREKAEAVYLALTEEISVKAAVFHEALTLLQRDRNAAWFAERDGARILICSEIGSEGRNFQFAHHLVLFDLPLNPELLEQRIGRLDRIGQNEPIRIHMPFLEGSCTELLLRWHHEGLDGVVHSLRGGNAYLERFGERIRELGPVYHSGTSAVRDASEALIEDSRTFRTELEARLSAGQDRLIAYNSFREEVSDVLIDQIRALDGDRTLDQFMNRMFDFFGVSVEDIGERTFHLSPGQLFTDAFPGLPREGTTMTADRVRALGREDIGFLTWDHPMTRGAIDLILSSEQGNSAIVIWPDPDPDLPALLIEAVYVLESVAPSGLHVDRFLPPTPVRILVDAAGDDHTDAISHLRLNGRCRDEEAFRLRQNGEVLQSLVPEMLRAARGHAAKRKSAILEHALREAHARLDGEARRLRDLQRVNPDVRDAEIELAESFVEDVTRHIGGAHLRLDAVRLILRAPE